MTINFRVSLTCCLGLSALVMAAATLSERSNARAAQDDQPYVNQHYPDFGFLPSPLEYKGRVFTLSQHYPKTEPPASERPDFLKIDFQKNWRDYLLAAQDYCFKDNVLGGDVADDFDAAIKDQPTWFHVPWQHCGPNGREGVHGLTKEAPVAPQQLAISQSHQGGQMYAVAIYNHFGGYVIGKVWADKDKPNAHDVRFPVGTVVMKVLFTDVPSTEVPSLENPLKWNAYVTENYLATNRVFKEMTLIQMDLMVRDERAPHGWVFGNYQYNGKMNNANKWKNLVPVGIQWGNDPDVTDGTWGGYTNPIPVVTRRNPHLKETIINPDDNELPPTHLGWNGRLNGPADNYLSSCMSCHMTAQSPTKSPISPLFQPADKVPSVGSTGWMRWFQNLNYGERFDADKPTSSMDYSLQLALSLQNYYQWKDAAHRTIAARYRDEQLNPVGEDVTEDYEILRSQPVELNQINPR
ncbi:hypothetical protein [Schlesneria sp. T3-172]|uniref:hypothetical protein n=1 Tax=Schlesneria sphaerica TaxID=3373610 RepID=UPI0037C96408